MCRTRILTRLLTHLYFRDKVAKFFECFPEQPPFRAAFCLRVQGPEPSVAFLFQNGTTSFARWSFAACGKVIMDDNWGTLELNSGIAQEVKQMKNIVFLYALLIILLSAGVFAAENNGNGACSAIQGQLAVEGNSFDSSFTIDGVVEPVVQIVTSNEPTRHGTMDRGNEYAQVISLVDGSSFYFYEDFTSTHSQNVLTTDPVLYGHVNATGTIVGASGRWANATGHMTMHGSFNFAVNSIHLWFSGNICGI